MVVLAGEHGAAHAAEAIAAVAGPAARRPLVLAAGDRVPAFGGEGALVLVLGGASASASGDRGGGPAGSMGALAVGAARRGADVVVVSEEGALADSARAAGLPLALVEPAAAGFPPDDPAQRACFASLLAAGLLLAGAARVFPGSGEAVEAARVQAALRGAELASPGGGVAGTLAAALRSAVPLAVGSVAVGALAARRLKAAVTAAAKKPAVAAAYPSFATEELCGFGQLGDVTRQLVVAVEVRCDHEHPAADRWFSRARALVDEAVVRSVELRAGGEGAAAQLVDLVAIADAAAVMLATAEGVDAGPLAAATEVLGPVRSR